MSELSQLKSVYDEVVTYGEMVDRVIERLGSKVPDPNCKKLGRLLVDASDQGIESQSVEALKLDSLVRARIGEPYAGLKQLGERLLSDKFDADTVDQLEALARRLEIEKAEIGRKLKRV